MRDEGKLNTLKEQLKIKLGTLSNPLEERLTTTSLEKLNELTLNTFNRRCFKNYSLKKRVCFVLSYFSFTYCLKILPLSS